MDTWNQLLSLRGLAAQIESSRTANQRDSTYSSKLLASFSVQHAVMTMTLLPANRPALAGELRRHPFETEIFKGKSFTARSWPECLLRAALCRRLGFRHPAERTPVGTMTCVVPRSRMSVRLSAARERIRSP